MTVQQLDLSLPSETTLEEQARRFHEANPHVYQLFCRFTYEVIDAQIERGERARFGAKAVFERLRFEALKTKQTWGGRRYVLNNNHTAYYARMFHRDHPHLGPVFELRKTKED